MPEESKNGKADFTLRDGREINFDLYALTYDEYLSFFDTKQTEDEAKEILSRVSGLEVPEIGGLPFAEYRLFTKAFFTAARKPISDPNL